MWNVIEKYLRDHREEIDRDEPRPEVWEAIERQLDRSARRRQMAGWWKMAAAILIVAGTAFWWVQFAPRQQHLSLSSSLNQVTHSVTAPQQSPEVVANRYQARVDSLHERVDRLKPYEGAQKASTSARYTAALADIEHEIAAKRQVLSHTPGDTNLWAGWENLHQQRLQILLDWEKSLKQLPATPH
jgi:hypothetical protein